MKKTGKQENFSGFPDVLIILFPVRKKCMKAIFGKGDIEEKCKKYADVAGRK